MTLSCRDCGVTYEARGAWQVRCAPCWRARRDREHRKALAGAWDAGWAAGYSAAPTSALGTNLLRDLVLLAHPDRHPPERAALANRATAALLDLLARERARKRRKTSAATMSGAPW